MSLTHTIWVQEQNNVLFDNLDQLNKDLMSGTMHEYADSSDGDTFITLATADSKWPEFKVGDILFVNEAHNGTDPQIASETWGLFGLDSAMVIANHMISGKLVFRVDIEGNQPQWYAMIPGVAKRVNPEFNI